MTSSAIGWVLLRSLTSGVLCLLKGDLGRSARLDAEAPGSPIGLLGNRSREVKMLGLFSELIGNTHFPYGWEAMAQSSLEVLRSSLVSFFMRRMTIFGSKISSMRAYRDLRY